MIKGVIYDFDNLMVNSYPIHREADKAVLEEYHVSYGDIPIELSSRFVGKKICEIYRNIIDYFNLDADLNKILSDREDVFLKLIEEKLEVMPGLVTSLEVFKNKGLRLALGTSGTRKYIDVGLKRIGLTSCFDEIITGDEVKKGKPDPEVFVRASYALGFTTELCLVLEDAENGVKAAKDAGCYCIAIKHPMTPPQNLFDADLILKSLEEINNHIFDYLF